VLSISERRACAALGQHRSTQRKIPRGREDEERLTADIVAFSMAAMAIRKVAEFLRRAGWLVNDKRVERIWRREGLKVPARQPKRARLWLNDGSCIRLRAERRNHVWSYDFVEERTHDGRKFRMLNIIDEFTHECLAIRVSRRLKSSDVIDALSDLFIRRGARVHPFRQRPGVHRPSGAGLDRRRRLKDRLHQPGQPVGERLYRELQCALARRASRWRNLLFAARGRDRHRELATTLQHGQAACLDRLSGSCPGGVRASARRMAGCATPTSSAGHASAAAKTGPKLTFKPDHQAGADQSRGLI